MSEETKVTVNREYKSTVFSLLYNDRNKLLSLYNALNQSNFTNAEELEIVTLENAIYMAMKNDKAFILDHRLNLYEHQSTPNPNMPLRHLFYVAKEYEKLVVERSLYSSKKVKIPTPRFVVFYNGTEVQPERKLLKLSDLYEAVEENPTLELQVLFLNINEGYNQQIKEDCRSLKEYMLFVESIRRYVNVEKFVVEEAVERAVIECIREGVLKDFLLANRAEVVAMSIFEYDEAKELKLLREAEYQAGVEDGRIEGELIGREEGLKTLICTLKKYTQDFEVIFSEVISNEPYKHCTREHIRKYYYLNP